MSERDLGLMHGIEAVTFSILSPTLFSYPQFRRHHD